MTGSQVRILFAAPALSTKNRTSKNRHRCTIGARPIRHNSERRRMRLMLTDRFCSRVKLREGEVQADYYDEAVSGLALRVGQKKSWTLHYGGRDSRKRLTFGTYPTLGLAAARTKALEAKQEIEAGRSPIKAVDTFKSIAEDWLTRDGANLRSKDKRKSALERLVYDVIGDRPIADIKRSEIVRLLDQIEDNQGPVMADW